MQTYNNCKRMLHVYGLHNVEIHTLLTLLITEDVVIVVVVVVIDIDVAVCLVTTSCSCCNPAHCLLKGLEISACEICHIWLLRG